MQFTCLARYRDCTGSVVAYDLFCDTNGQYVSLTANELKSLIVNGDAIVSNLKLNVNGALLLIKKKGMNKPKDIWPSGR